MNLESMRTPLLLAILASITVPASADLFIYEPFDYPDTGPLNDLSYFGDGTQTGALGTTGAWSELSNADNADGSPTNGFDVRAVGLTFTDVGGNELPVTGGLVTRDNRVGQSAASIAVELLVKNEAANGETLSNQALALGFGLRQ